MNVEKRFTYEPPYVTFRSYLNAATVIARQKFVRDHALLTLQWDASGLPAHRFDEWTAERLLERSPIVGTVE